MEESDHNSRSSQQDSAATDITTPEVQSGEDDVWASDDNHDSAQIFTVTNNRNDMLSDLPTVKRQHMTDGYREGLAIGKAKVMQSGFDAGYPIGVAIALRVGKILGFIEGVLAAKGISDEAKVSVQKTLNQAKKELAITALMKDRTDQDIMSYEGVPPSVLDVLSKWEDKVFGSAGGSDTIPLRPKTADTK